ncbi:hypothetical protein BGZ96_004023 [Linnemannia gamsii]|uniref:3CxxC-type domain-containing protein n=1 Tax=Linnemannia gamsii TaxID=64522 RepID=A0ABQ7K7F3_9FUNG|nr:hypothetical protein BGZ96_004023 [Linnemannia gamsii]
MTRYRNMDHRPATTSWARSTPGMEYDGFYLHTAVVQESGPHYKYYKQLSRASSNRNATRQIVAHFRCHNCSHTWHTGQLCVQLFLASNDRYRTILHAQQCQGCEAYVEPQVDEENYVKKIVGALDLWTNRRERQEPMFDRKTTGPHDEERCHGCQIGICSR